MTALESVLNASIQIEDNRKSKKTYSFRFNNNQVCKHVENTSIFTSGELQIFQVWINQAPM